jgi:hypothetical protein
MTTLLPRAKLFVAVAAIGGVVAVAHAAPGLPSHGASPTIVRSSRPAVHSPCGRDSAAPTAYHYPIKPFLRQHPIRGNFGDPRTAATESPFGADTRRSAGSFTFHNGVDIFARTGTPVYPVVSGTARIGYADEVIVTTRHFRTFQYFHVRPLVRDGQRVIADRTVLGTVRPEWLHVHLTEIDGFRVHNPADPGHLEPYVDHTVPRVDSLRFTAEAGRDLEPQALYGRIEIAATAADYPPVPVPGEWFGFPVTPAVVDWMMRTANGRVVVPWTTVADFRHTEPPNRDFWRVYAAGTYQNFPIFGHHYFVGRDGRYVFNLTPSALDTRRLHDGEYVVRVQAADVCGNRGGLSERISIDNDS